MMKEYWNFDKKGLDSLADENKLLEFLNSHYKFMVII